MENMTEKLASLIIESLSGLINYPFGKHIIVFLTSIMPVLELRGGLIAAALLNLPPWESYAIAIVANLIPIPFLKLTTPISNGGLILTPPGYFSSSAKGGISQYHFYW